VVSITISIMNFYKCLGSDSLPGEDLQDDKTINRMIKYLIFLKIYIWFLITANGLCMKRTLVFGYTRAEFLNFLFYLMSQKPNLKNLAVFINKQTSRNLNSNVLYTLLYSVFFLEYSVRNQRQVNLWSMEISLFLNCLKLKLNSKECHSSLF
jgi:hypothetical protein